MCTEMTPSVAIHLVGGHADYVNICDSPRTGRPHTAQTPDNLQCVNSMVLKDRCATVKETSIQLGIREASVCRILKRVGLKKFVETGF
jgi:hypothetical protein